MKTHKEVRNEIRTSGEWRHGGSDVSHVLNAVFTNVLIDVWNLESTYPSDWFIWDRVILESMDEYLDENPECKNKIETFMIRPLGTWRTDSINLIESSLMNWVDNIEREELRFIEVERVNSVYGTRANRTFRYRDVTDTWMHKIRALPKYVDYIEAKARREKLGIL